MRAEYKFLRTRAGVTSFAVVGIDSSPSDSWSLSWNRQLLDLERVFGDAVEEGVMLAAREHTKQGGNPQQVEVISLMQTYVDTCPDAVVCAAAVATWKSLGHPEASICIKFQDGQWMPSFECVPVKGS